MIYTLLVHGAPASSQSCHSALAFAQAAISRGHVIGRVFFFRDAVHAAAELAVYRQDEIDLHSEWKEIALQHGIEMVVCISAALARGVLDKNESERYDRAAYTTSSPFELSGLGQLVDGMVNTDRIVSFGA